MPKNYTYTTPCGSTYDLFTDALKQPHVLIAGATGSGKSVLINGLISTLLHRFPFNRPDGAQMILIDPKRVELARYANLPHTLTHAAGHDPEAWKAALRYAVSVMDQRYTEMERRGELTYTGGDLYVIIDEWANVYKNGGKECYTLTMRLTSEGRAARVHCIIATQVPKANVLPSEIRENCTARFCLRTANSIQSRVIMEQNGCEILPDPQEAGEAHGYYKKGLSCPLYRIPYVQPSEIAAIVRHWEAQQAWNRKPRLFRGPIPA